MSGSSTGWPICFGKDLCWHQIQSSVTGLAGLACLAAERNFKFGVNISLSRSRWATPQLFERFYLDYFVTIFMICSSVLNRAPGRRRHPGLRPRPRPGWDTRLCQVHLRLGAALEKQPKALRLICTVPRFQHARDRWQFTRSRTPWE